MSEEVVKAQLAQSRETVRRLQDELAETDRGLAALSTELEERVAARTAELQAARKELEHTNAGLLALHAEIAANEERMRHTLDAAPVGMLKVDAAGVIILANAELERLFGYGRGELAGQKLDLLLPERFRAAHPGHRAGFMKSPHARPMGAGRDLFGRRKDGSEFPVEIGLNPLETPKGMSVVASVIDITERKQAEAAIRASLAEKEVLLREIHHRVKNNLQVVSGILGLQRAQLNDPKLEAIFTEAEARVRSMALVHQRLYQEHTLSSIEFASYLKSLTQDLVAQSVTPGGPKVRLELDLAEAPVPVDTAIPLGLIANELLTNALKYAYRGRTEGVLRLSLQPAGEGRLELAVSDDGPGLLEGFDPATATSLGLQLVRMLAHQIGGKAEFLPGPGAPCRIHFPLQPPTLKTAA